MPGNNDQPRVPAGSADGGEWTARGGSIGASKDSPKTTALRQKLVQAKAANETRRLRLAEHTQKIAEYDKAIAELGKHPMLAEAVALKHQIRVLHAKIRQTKELTSAMQREMQRQET